MGTTHLIPSISFLFLTITLGASDPLIDSFITCLNQRSLPSHPIDGKIYTPNNSSFPSVLKAYIRNLRFAALETPKPAVIVTAAHESHVQAVVFCAQCHGMQMRTRSGGHDYEGLSYMADVTFVLLDMFNLRAVDINVKDRTAKVQAGAILGELYYGVAQKSRNTLAFPGGVCTALGLGGFISGGGYGSMMRKYGLAADNVLDAQIVDVNGDILDRAAMGEDLFWAIRGGGGSSFGVIVSWTLKLVPVPQTVTGFQIDKTLEQGGTKLVHRWLQIADKLDENLFIRLWTQVVNKTSPTGRVLRKTINVQFVALYLGRANQLLTVMGRSFPELGLTQKDCTEMRWIDHILQWYFPTGTPVGAVLNRTRTIFSLKRKSDYVQKPISTNGLNAIWKKMMSIEKVVLDWNPYGATMSKIGESETPFPHRAGNIGMIQYVVNWMEPGVAAANRYINLVRELHGFMMPYVSKYPREAYLNYRDLDIGSNSDNDTDYQRALVYGKKYFKQNFERLVEVKTKVDPNNFFKHKQSIPPRP